MAKFELVKDTGKVKFMLEKRSISQITAEVVSIVDVSGSMQQLFFNGTVQEAIQRVIPVALNFDDNGDIPVYIFDDGYALIKEPLTKDNYANYVKDEVINRASWGGTSLYPVLSVVIDDLGFNGTTTAVRQEAPGKKAGFLGRLFGAKDEAPQSRTVSVRGLRSNSNTGLPAIAYVFTDGENGDTERTRDLLTQLSKANSEIYFNFIGVGRANFSFLARTAKSLPNVGFVQIEDLQKVGGGDEIYEYLLPTELTDWLRKFMK